MTSKVETRATDWIENPRMPHTAYRIWKRASQWGWEQRHEWRFLDTGRYQMDEWIRSSPGFPAHYRPVVLEAV